MWLGVNLIGLSVNQNPETTSWLSDWKIIVGLFLLMPVLKIILLFACVEESPDFLIMKKNIPRA
jgi:hypothetical protein